MLATCKALAVAASFATGLVAANAAVAAVAGDSFDVKELSALGLCAFMVWRNYQNQRDLGRVIKSERALVEAKNEQLVALHEKTLATITAHIAALRSVPCLKASQEDPKERP